MMAKRSVFKQADATRALRAAIAAGLKPSGCTIGPDGSIKLDFTEAAAIGPRNSWDRVLKQ